MGTPRRYAYFYSSTSCFENVEVDGVYYACGGTLELAFNLIEGRVDYVWCAKCGHIHYQHENYGK